MKDIKDLEKAEAFFRAWGLVAHPPPPKLRRPAPPELQRDAIRALASALAEERGRGILVALGAASPFAEPAPIVPACPDCLDVFPGHRAWCGVMRAAADARICGRSVDELAAGGPRIWRCVRDKGHGGACG